MPILAKLLRTDLDDFIRSRMMHKKLTVAVLARRSNVSRQAIYNLLKRNSTGAQTLYKIAPILGMSIESFLRSDD